MFADVDGDVDVEKIRLKARFKSLRSLGNLQMVNWNFWFLSKRVTLKPFAIQYREEFGSRQQVIK